MTNNCDFPNHAGRYSSGPPSRNIPRPRLSSGLPTTYAIGDGGYYINYYQFGLDFSEVPLAQTIDAEANLLGLLQSIAKMQRIDCKPDMRATARALLDGLEDVRGRTRTLEMVDWYNRNRKYDQPALKKLGARYSGQTPREDLKPFKRKINVKGRGGCQ